jgi:alpha-beta hydrolase superfamily lysophospholipase
MPLWLCAGIANKRRQNMAKQLLPVNFRSLYPRLLSFGIGYGDLERISSAAADWPSFSHGMAELGQHWEKSADEALQAGGVETAGQHWLRAAAYYHYAQLRLSDSAMKDNMRVACRRCYQKFTPLSTPRVVRCEIPFEGTTLPGYLRVKNPGAPCVILIGGLDSAKEVELHHFAEIFLSRSCSVFYFDGPGQGELYRRCFMALGFEKAVSSVIKFLSADSRVQPARFGCFGVSFGGYLACLSSALNPRIQACVSTGGFFDHRILGKLPPIAAETVKNVFGFSSDVDMSEIAPYVTLEPSRGKMAAPLLIVHGTADHLVDMEQIEAMQQWASGPVETIMLQGSEHVGCDRFNEYLPRMGDWMTTWLMHKNEMMAVV